MKKILPLVIAIVFAACGNNDAKQEEQTDTEPGSKYSWQAVLNDSTGKLEIRKRDTQGPDSLSPQAVINFINAGFPNIKLQLIKSSNDTLYVTIPDATYLTQQMGSTGPDLYFAEAVFNLTEIPGIRFVNFDFKEGDHAQPDTFNRESFKEE